MTEGSNEGDLSQDAWDKIVLRFARVNAQKVRAVLGRYGLVRASYALKRVA